MESYSKERNIGIPCIQRFCKYNTTAAAFRCEADKNGVSGIKSCPAYQPLEVILGEETDISILRNIFLKDPGNGEDLNLTLIKGHEAGLDHLEITAKGETSTWLYKIYIEEI